MEIEILVFKESGKWYASQTVKNDIDIPLFKDEFKEFIKKNLPANIGEGYVVVLDKGEHQGFHMRHYKYNDLF